MSIYSGKRRKKVGNPHYAKAPALEPCKFEIHRLRRKLEQMIGRTTSVVNSKKYSRRLNRLGFVG